MTVPAESPLTSWIMVDTVPYMNCLLDLIIEPNHPHIHSFRRELDEKYRSCEVEERPEELLTRARERLLPPS